MNVQLPWPIFPEEEVLAKLLKSSKEFSAFYKEEREKFKEPLLWAQDITLAEGINGRATTITSSLNSSGPEVHVIRLRRIPARIEDSFLVAHELGHFLLIAEGYPLVGSVANERLSSLVTTLVHDPLVDARLKKYGFDLRPAYRAEVEESRRQLVKRPRSPTDRLTRIAFMLTHVGNLLHWELLGEDDQCNEFKRWFEERYPDIASMGAKLLIRVKKVGYDTPEKQTLLFREIIYRHRIDKEVIF